VLLAGSVSAAIFTYPVTCDDAPTVWTVDGMAHRQLSIHAGDSITFNFDSGCAGYQMAVRALDGASVDSLSSGVGSYSLSTSAATPECLIYYAPSQPNTIAEGRAIDLSIQFLLFWTPVVTLLGWWLNKPVSLLFDLFEVTLLIGACFLVNYVTADSKTNWAEGFVLVSFYLMIGLSAWHYTGQNEVRLLDACESVATAIANGVGQEQ